MGRIIKSIIWIIKLLEFKLIYHNMFIAGILQKFEHVHISISKRSKIKIGSYNENRGCFYLICSGGKLQIGSHCFFNINASVTCVNHIVIGDYCCFGNNLVIVDHDHNIKNEQGGFIKGEVIIGNNVWVGANVTILKDTYIGDNCVIAAGSVVKGKVPPNTILVQKRENSFY